MTNNLKSINPLVASAAQLELSRISRDPFSESIKREDIEAFKKDLRFLQDKLNEDPEIHGFLSEVIKEFFTIHPWRRRNDVHQGVSDVLCDFNSVLGKESPVSKGVALRLYEFCHIFSNHINRSESLAHNHPRIVAII